MPNATSLGSWLTPYTTALGQYAITYDTATTSDQFGTWVWPTWNGIYTTAANTVASDDSIWGNWDNWYIKASGLGSGNIAQQAAQARGNQAPGIIIQSNESNFLSVAERQLREDAYHREQKAKAAAAIEAERRATELLLDHLDAQQVADFKRARRFIVHSRDGERAYRIHYGKQGNVYLLDKDRRTPVASYCIHPDINCCPIEDVMLAQKLLLEADEKEFLRIANRRPWMAAA